MSIEHLNHFFNAKSIAVVGASRRMGAVGHTVVRNLVDSGFEGDIHPVNPKAGRIAGLPCHASLSDIAKPPDLVVVVTPIDTVPGIIRECGRIGTKAAIVISSGGKETGTQGRALEEEILKASREGNVRIIGPNCLGVISTPKKINASFASHMPWPGKMAFISQSGAICTAILDWALSENIGFSHFVSIGAMVDVDFGDLIDYMGNDSKVDSIILYIEALSNVRKFMSAARAVSRVKPIVVLKAGRSQAGALAAASHTGAMTGEDAVYDEGFRRAGLVRVHSIEELFDCAELMAKQPRPRGPNLAIVTNSGGPGVMAADELADLGLEPAKLSPDTMKKLNEMLPPFWSRGNPIDILGDATVERYVRVVETCLEAKEIDGLVIMICPQAITAPTLVAEALCKIIKKRPSPIFTVLMGGLDVEKGRELLSRSGIPTYDSPERAVKAFNYMWTYEKNLKMLQEIPAALPSSLEFDRERAAGVIDSALSESRNLLMETESKELLQAYGIPVAGAAPAATVEEAVGQAGKIGYPVVLKLHSPDITHKSDAGGVKLNLIDENQVRQAFEDITVSAEKFAPKARIMGVTVQPMLKALDYELILGGKKDPFFGPVLLFGLGGIMTEILKDRSLALPPMNRLLARRMMESTRVYRLLQGYRGKPPVDLGLLEEIIVRLSQMFIDFPQLTELDINPLSASGSRIIALDARVVIESAKPTPRHEHLVISPYPNEYERTLTTKGGLGIRVRPIRPEDTPLLTEMTRTLSQRSIYLRFCGAIREYSPQLLARLTQIDYDREMALVALDAESPGTRMLGVARAIHYPDGRSAELAVVVGDPWQGKGIGACLMKHLMDICIQRGITTLFSYILSENTVTRILAKKLGWKRDDEDRDFFTYTVDESRSTDTAAQARALWQHSGIGLKHLPQSKTEESL